MTYVLGLVALLLLLAGLIAYLGDRLHAGGRGIFGPIVEASMRLMPAPEAEQYVTSPPATSTAADVTGLLAAGLLFSLGLFILPYRRRKAKAELKEKIAALRTELMTTLRAQFESEAERSRTRLANTIAPYTRFVRTESDRLNTENRELTAMLGEVESLKAKVENLI